MPINHVRPKDKYVYKGRILYLKIIFSSKNDVSRGNIKRSTITSNGPFPSINRFIKFHHDIITFDQETQIYDI